MDILHELLGADILVLGLIHDIDECRVQIEDHKRIRQRLAALCSSVLQKRRNTSL